MEIFDNWRRRDTNSGSWNTNETGADGSWKIVLKHLKQASTSELHNLLLSVFVDSVAEVDKTWSSELTTPKSIKARTCWSVPLANDPNVTADSNRILSLHTSAVLHKSCKSLGTTPCAITDPFWRLLPITEFFKHLKQD